MIRIYESHIEQLVIELLEAQGFGYLSPEEMETQRPNLSEVVLPDRLASAVHRLNPILPEAARQEAIKAVRAVYSPQLIDANETFHRYLTEGVPVTIRKDGHDRGEKVWLVDFQNPNNNDFLAVNQYTVIERSQNKRPDIVLLINGLPLVVIELKNPADQQATVRKAYDQIQTYKKVIPSLFFFNAICVVSDGLEARAGTITSPFSRFAAWKSVDGKADASALTAQVEILVKGMLNNRTLLDLIRNFIVFEKDKKTDVKTGLMQVETSKKIAAYHQYFAVNKAVESTRFAAADSGSRKAGVIWHTQGSGKSISMVFYTGKLIGQLDNPTVVVITDRNDLDDQLFDTFAASTQLLRQPPIQAQSREHLKSLLKVASGGIVFTTIQKFFPDGESASYEKLSDRKNIIVIADEAHRTQYGFKARIIDSKDKSGKRIAYGFAKYLRDAIPNATFIGFTGTPVESTDVNTPAVFGNYIDIYDIARAVEDKATVKIYYESRLAKVNLTEEGRRLIEDFEKQMLEDGSTPDQQAKVKWTKIEAIVGHPKRIKNLAQDIVSHYENRSEVFDGKAMIVAMSRRIAVALYNEIIALRPGWHTEDLNTGVIKVVMTSSSSDKMEFDPEDPDSLVIPAYNRTNKENRRVLSDRMKDPNDPLKIVIVRDMWLTGFDVPCLHTLYIDKLMKDHTLMQAIARVNRVFMDKPGGLIVDYIGIGNALKKAMSFYSGSGGKGDPAEAQEKAVQLLLEKIEVVREIFHGFDVSRFFAAPTSEKLSMILQGEEFVLGQPDGKERFIRESTILSRVFALAVPDEKALELKDEIAFYQTIRARLLKFDGPDGTGGGGGGSGTYESAIRQIVNQAVQSTEVVDIFDAAGIKKPEISLLSEEFLQEVKGLKHKNLAIELLKKILNDQIVVKTKFNIVESKKLLEMLEDAIRKYQNNLLTTAEIIEELIAIARHIREVESLAEKLNLSQDEFAFYTALGVNDSAVQVLGDQTLRTIARIIAQRVHANASIDWTLKESARAKLMVIVRRTLNEYGYPPDKQPQAIETVLKQAEALADHWVQSENE